MSFPLIYQPTSPIDAIVFDCDGTLSTIEGIDELAKLNQVGEKVQLLTKEAMDHTGINLELYRKRLNLVYPLKSQVDALGQQYFHHQVPDAAKIIQISQRLNKAVYLVSAGLKPAVTIFGKLLKIPQENIFAVDIHFDAQGQYQDFDTASPLVDYAGKRQITAYLKEKHKNILHIGDGMNDFVTSDMVTRFVGYGGVFYRKNIAEQCQYYIKSLSLAALLPLLLTSQEQQQLIPAELAIYQEGLKAIENNMVTIKQR